MKPSELKQSIISRFKANIERPLYVASSPGLGKTQVVVAAAKDLGVACMVLHAPLMQPEDYGFPVISADRTDVDFIVSKAKFPIEGSPCPEQGILFLDELSQADNSTQKILAQAILAREIHGRKFKPGWFIVAAGNRATDRAGAARLLSQLGDRVTQVALEASLDDWSQWALDNGVKTEVVSFIRFRPELLNQFDPQQDISPTPRAWVDGVSKALGVTEPALEFETFKGDVGEGAAAEFCGFLRIYRQLPSPDAIITNPTGIDVPSDPATLYALCGALAHRASADNFGRIMQYIERMAPEFSVLFVRDALKRNKAIQATAEFIKWASGPGAKLLT